MSSLPSAWVDALFKRFTQIWGVQKVSASFAPPEPGMTDWMEEVMALWGAQLGRFNGATLKAALQACIDSGKEWPPTLPEFRALCSQYNRPESIPAGKLLANDSRGSSDIAAENLRKIHAMLQTTVKRI